MKQITCEMPVVEQCSVTECAYNTDSCCHARAITVGHSVHPGCDTYLVSPSHTKAKQRTAGVGACKVSVCRYNEDYECVADGIKVGYASADVNCLTFTPR